MTDDGSMALAEAISRIAKLHIDVANARLNLCHHRTEEGDALAQAEQQLVDQEFTLNHAILELAAQLAAWKKAP